MIPPMRSISSRERERISDRRVLASSHLDTKGRLRFARKKEAENQYKPPIARRGTIKSNGFFLVRRKLAGRYDDDGDNIVVDV